MAGVVFVDVSFCKAALEDLADATSVELMYQTSEVIRSNIQRIFHHEDLHFHMPFLAIRKALVCIICILGSLSYHYDSGRNTGC